MAIYDFFLSRNGAANTPENYVGHTGRLFYNSATGEIRLSDGATPGGLPIPITIATSTQTGAVKPGAGLTVTAGGTLTLNTGPSFYFDEAALLRLRPGTADRIGGIKAGPGVAIDSEGTLFIDSEGLSFTFGDFTGTVGTYTDSTDYALLSSIKENEDIVIASNGTGDIKVVGGFEVYATDGTVTGSLEEEPFFRILDDGQVRILVPLADTTQGGMEIIGSLLGTSLAPGQAGTMLHLTGNANIPTRVYHDTLSGYGSYVFRRYNGSVVSPTQVLANEDIARFNWTAANDAGMPNQATAQIRVTALENQTTTAQGSKMVFTLTPLGQPTSARVDVATISVEDGVSATKFTGPLTGNVTGNVTGSAGSVAAANITGTTLASNVVTSSLTSVGTLANLTVTNTITGSVSGSAGSVANALTAGTYLTSTGTYNGSTARTFAVDATTDNTVSKVVARDSNGIVAGTNFQSTVRNAGSVGGTTLTLNWNTDSMVHCTFTDNFTVAFSNYTAGRTITLIATNTSGFDSDVVTAGISAVNMQGDSTLTVTQQTTAIITYYCTGTTVDSVYASAVYA